MIHQEFQRLLFRRWANYVSKNVARSKTKEKVRLSDQEFVDAAVRLAKKVGLNKLTMRALADELQVSPMALYYYIPGKDELLILTVDAIFAHGFRIAAMTKADATESKS